VRATLFERKRGLQPAVAVLQRLPPAPDQERPDADGAHRVPVSGDDTAVQDALSDRRLDGRVAEVLHQDRVRPEEVAGGGDLRVVPGRILDQPVIVLVGREVSARLRLAVQELQPTHRAVGRARIAVGTSPVQDLITPEGRVALVHQLTAISVIRFTVSSAAFHGSGAVIELAPASTVTPPPTPPPAAMCGILPWAKAESHLTDGSTRFRGRLSGTIASGPSSPART